MLALKRVEHDTPVVPFIFTSVKRCASQMLSCYPVADALLSCELCCTDATLCLETLLILCITPSRTQQPNSAQF